MQNLFLLTCACYLGTCMYRHMHTCMSTYYATIVGIHLKHGFNTCTHVYMYIYTSSNEANMNIYTCNNETNEYTHVHIYPQSHKSHEFL